MRSSPNTRTMTSHPPSRHHESEYRRDEEHHPRSPGHHHHLTRDERTHNIQYRYVCPQPPPVPSKEAVQKLSMVATSALQLFQYLQSSFARETAKLHYVMPQIMDYIWEDKLKYADMHGIVNANNKTESQQHSNNNRHIENSHEELILINSQPVGISSTLKHLQSTLDTAISATVYETRSSAGDNRTLAEKLSRMGHDIRKTRDGIFTHRKDMDALITDLEMLSVLLKRHGGGGGGSVGTSDQLKERNASDGSAGSEAPVQRQAKFEHASVIDEKEEEDESGFTEQEEAVGSGVRSGDEEESLGAGNNDNSGESNLRE